MKATNKAKSVQCSGIYSKVRAESFFDVDPLAGLALPMRELRNSKSHPYVIDFVDLKVTGTPFSIGMGAHPGRRDAGLSADWDRDLAVDFDAIWDAGIRTIVCTVEAHEFELLRVPRYIMDAEVYGFEVIWYPIRDVSIPVSFKQMHKTCHEVYQRLQVGHVLVHCRGGKGRTGMTVCSYLQLIGYPFGSALHITRNVRKGTVETATQEAWCVAFGKYVKCTQKKTKLAGS